MIGAILAKDCPCDLPKWTHKYIGCDIIMGLILNNKRCGDGD